MLCQMLMWYKGTSNFFQPCFTQKLIFFFSIITLQFAATKTLLLIASAFLLKNILETCFRSRDPLYTFVYMKFLLIFCILLVPTDFQTFVHNCVHILFAYIPSNFSFIVR